MRYPSRRYYNLLKMKNRIKISIYLLQVKMISERIFINFVTAMIIFQKCFWFQWQSIMTEIERRLMKLP